MIASVMFGSVWTVYSGKSVMPTRIAGVSSGGV